MFGCCILILTPTYFHFTSLNELFFVISLFSPRRQTDSSTTAEQSSSSDMDSMGDVSVLIIIKIAIIRIYIPSINPGFFSFKIVQH